jgi:hypothetical protein
MERDTAEPSVRSMPGDRAREWAEYHGERAAKTTYVYDFVWDITGEAEGPFCVDVDGNVLMDFTSHVAAAPLGYNNPKVMDRAREFDLVDPLKIAGQDFYVSDGTTPGEERFPGPSGLMDRLTDLTSQYDMDRVFLSNSGAEAVENGIKACYDSRGGAAYGVTFEGAFHGRTLGALSLNRSKAVHRKRYPELPGIVGVPFCADGGCTAASCDCGFFIEGGASSRLRRKFDGKRGNVDPDEVAYIILDRSRARAATGSRATPSWRRSRISPGRTTSRSSPTRSRPASGARDRCGPSTTRPWSRTSSRPRSRCASARPSRGRTCSPRRRAGSPRRGGPATRSPRCRARSPSTPSRSTTWWRTRPPAASSVSSGSGTRIRPAPSTSAGRG